MVTKKKHNVAAGRRFPATIRPHESAAHGQVVDRPARGRRAAAQMVAYDGQVIRLKQRQGQRRGKKKNASAIVAIAFLKFGMLTILSARA
jgi:hypothetical protein